MKLMLLNVAAAALLLAAFTLLASCGDSAITIPLHIRAELAFSASTALEKYANQYDVSFPNPYPNNREFPPVNILQPIDIFQSINFDNKKSLKQHKDNLKSVFIDSVKFTVTQNDLSHPIEKIYIWIGKRSKSQYSGAYYASSDKENYTLLTRLSPIKPGETASFYLFPSYEGEKLLGELIPKLGLALWVEAFLHFDSTAETPDGVGALPSGGVEAILEIHLTALGDAGSAI
ncbi:MAG: hypothetical protein Kow0090_15210 [Myxococcota bacterium]